MYIREGIFGNVPSARGLRLKRIWLFVLAIYLLQVKKAKSFTDHASKTGSPHALPNQSLNSSAVTSTIPGKDGLQASTLERQRLHQGRLHSSSDEYFNSKKTHFTETVTYSSDNVAHLNNVTHPTNYSKHPRPASLTSPDGLPKPRKEKRGRSGITQKELKLLSNKLGLPRHQRYERKNPSDTIKTYINSRRKKRRKYSSPVHSGHPHHHRTHFHHHHRKKNLQKHNLVVAFENKLNGKHLRKSRRSLQHERQFVVNERYPLFHGSERVLLRFKRKSLLEGDGDEKPSKDRKKHKRKKHRRALHGHAKTRSVPRSNPVLFPLNEFARGNYPRSMAWKRPGLTRNPLNTALVTINNAISQTKYDPLIYGGRASSLSLKPYSLPSNAEDYTALSNRRQGVYNINTPPSTPLSPGNIETGKNQFSNKQQTQLVALPFRSGVASPEIRPAWNTRFQNGAIFEQTNIQQPVKFQIVNRQSHRSRLLKGGDQNKKKYIPAVQRDFYGYEHQYDYQPQFPKSHMPFTGGSLKNAPIYPQTGPNSPQFFLQERARMNPPWSSFLPALNANNLVSNHVGADDGDALRRSRVSQGLLMYLNFEDVQNGRATYASLKGDVTETDKRTEITRTFGSCGKAARLNNGSEILLDAKQLKEKPRQAVTIAAWVKLDTNKGFHSIFDTVGGHSDHKSGQYHFEVQDGSVRWFHRNESGDEIFSVETDPIIPANVWNHFVGTYDAHAGLAKIFVNGRLKAEGAGKGLLSQDWDAHAGIGKHKDERFLQGEVDEFRIYNKALSQGQIQNLTKACSFERECGGFFFSPTGIFESPEWPQSYKGKTSCTWHVTVDPSEKIALSFKSFSLDEDGTCGKAKLVVRDGSSENSNALGVYCGVKRPSVVTSSGNHLWVQFTSTKAAEGKGFLMSYDTATSRQTKKTERPPTPADHSQRCAITRPEYNVTLIGGIKSGIFSEAKHVHDMDLCTRHCCLRKTCDLAFMIRDSCYLVQCRNAMFCKTKKARPSNMNPRITFVSHLKTLTPEPELSADGSAFNKAVTPALTRPTTPPAEPQPLCHHTEISYNVTLVGGINAGKFSTYGRTRTMGECIRHCCRDGKCDVSFMIQGNCYAVECVDTEGCQVKRAKPSSYNPTVAYVYRGNQRPIGDPLPGAEKPSLDACDKYSVSNTIYNVTLRGGIKSGNFTDKGVVKNMDECSAFCCADEKCNVAFLIRDNCFLVSCKDYNACQVKPALSEYYHPRLAYVNWNPPDEEIPANRWYASLGCWKDTDSFAVASLEDSDPLLTDSYATRQKPIDTCAQVAKRHDFKVFAIQNGGACLSGPTAERRFNQFGESSSCRAGKGSLFANDVYRLTDSGSYVSLGCWNESGVHALPVLEHSDAQLDDFYKSRSDPLRKCGEVARKRGYTVFALQRGGMCFGGPRAEVDYRKYGMSRRCRDGLGGPYANSVYRLLDNLDLEFGPTESTRNSTSPTGTTGTSTFSTGTVASSSSTASTDFTPTTLTGTQRSPSTSTPSPTPAIHENYLTLQDGLPHKNTYTAGEILFNVTLKYGIKAGKFNDKGKVGNMSECVRACGRMESCSLAFMLGKQCFAVSCYNDALCLTKPAYSPFYKPKIAFVKHTKVIVTANKIKPSTEFGECRTSPVHNDVTLVGGINAGKFTDLGDADNISICTQRCCMKDACDVAFMLEGECYGVSCVNDSLCETRPARNPARYNPKIAYVYHDKKKDKALRYKKLRALMRTIERLLYGKTLQTGAELLPVNDKYTDNTDFSVDSDATSDVSNDVISTIPSDNHSNSKNIDETFSTDIFTPTTPRMHFETLVNSIKEGQMNVYAFPLFYNENDSQNGLSKTVTTPLPLKGVDNLSGSGDKMGQSTPSPNILGLFMKQMNSPKTDHVTSSSPPLTDPRNDTSHDVSRTNHVLSNSQSSDLTVDKVLKGLLHKWLHVKKHTRTWRDENEGLPGYYDNTNSDLMSLSNKDLDRFADYAMARLGHRQDAFASPNDFTNPPPLRVYENTPQIAQKINPLFDLSPTASTQQKSVCWDGQIFHNYTLVGGINAGTFTDNGKTSNMDICMQFCCKRQACDLAFMIEDDCYSVACNSNGACEPRKARPTHYFPRIAIRKRPQGDYHVKVPTDMSSTPATSSPSSSSSPSPTSLLSSSSSLTPGTSPSPPTSPPISGAHEDTSLSPAVKVTHSCDATPIEYNVTLKMGLHSGVFQKIGRVDAMDDCIEMSCKQPNSDVAFMLGSMCYAVHCYSADLCKTVPIFGSSISRLNLNPAVSFLKKSRFGESSLAVANDFIAPQDKCRDSTITYNVTLRGGIDAGNFTERTGILSMRECIGKCCEDASCDLAFMFGDHCYSVQCQSEKLCQAVLAKPSHLEPKVSYVTRGFIDDGRDKGTMFSASDQTPTCRADQKSRSKIVSNKTLVGGLEAGRFSFVGVVSDMDMCMDRCCAQRGCNVAYMVDKNCFSVACFSPSLCKISDVSSTNGDVEISTIMESTAERPAEKHSMVVYVIIGVVGFAAGAGGILWAVCMFIRRKAERSVSKQGHLQPRLHSWPDIVYDQDIDKIRSSIEKENAMEKMRL